jgi:hypothetical protein
MLLMARSPRTSPSPRQLTERSGHKKETKGKGEGLKKRRKLWPCRSKERELFKMLAEEPALKVLMKQDIVATSSGSHTKKDEGSSAEDVFEDALAKKVPPAKKSLAAFAQ